MRVRNFEKRKTRKIRKKIKQSKSFQSYILDASR